MKLSLNQKLLLAFGGLTTVILVMGGSAYYNIDRMLEANASVQHTTAVLDRIDRLNADFKKAQSAARAYLLSHDQVFFKTAEATMDRVMPDMLEIQRMTEDNPRQRENCAKLVPLLADRLANWERLASGGPDRFAKAPDRFKDPQAVQVNEEIDRLTSQMSVEEQNLLAKRRGRMENSARGSLNTLWLGALSATLFAFGMLLALRREIARREKFEEVLQLNEYRLFQFLEAIPLGVFVLDKDGRPFYANQKARELLGQGVVQASGSQDLSVLLNAYVAGTDQPYPADRLAIRRALKGEKCSIEDVEVHHPDGRIIPLQIWGTPVYGLKQDLQYALAILSDITERRHVEDMKHSLVSVVSHQLKTPVGEINGYIENLLDGLAGALSPKQSDYLMDMREIGMNNYRLISDLLNLSKIERGLATATLEKYPVMELVALAMRDYEAIMARKGLTLKLEGLAECPDVMADRDKLVETLRNLINNAIKFTDKGGLTISAEPKEQVVLLKVRDTGRGISDAAMAQLFQQKRVLGDEAGRAGAGLGLYVAKHFMKSQGGDISAVTSAGKGSCFTLTLRKAV